MFMLFCSPLTPDPVDASGNMVLGCVADHADTIVV